MINYESKAKQERTIDSVRRSIELCMQSLYYTPTVCIAIHSIGMIPQWIYYECTDNHTRTFYNALETTLIHQIIYPVSGFSQFSKFKPLNQLARETKNKFTMIITIKKSNQNHFERFSKHQKIFYIENLILRDFLNRERETRWSSAPTSRAPTSRVPTSRHHQLDNLLQSETASMFRYLE